MMIAAAIIMPLAGSILHSHPAHAQAPTWSTTGNILLPRYSFRATTLPNGKVLIEGGFAPGSYTTDSELFDPTTGVWTQTGSLNQGRGEHSATLLQNGRVLVAGGYAGPVLNSAEIYDTGTGTWTMTGSMSHVRTRHTATLLQNGMVLVAGGWDSSQISGAELYNPTAGSWSSAGNMSIPRADGSAVLLPNGKVLVAGGDFANSNGITGESELYDPTTNSWSATGSMNVARAGFDAVLLPDGKVLATGGGGTATAELYDPATGTWTLTGSMQQGRSAGLGLQAMLLAGGTVFIAGGDTAGTSEVYNPSNGTWGSLTNMVTPHCGAATALLLDGRPLIAGGSDCANLTTVTELYASKTPICQLNLTPPQPVGAPILKQLSCDPYTDKGAQHATEVEPDTLSAHTPSGTLIVSAFQVGRFTDGGAMNIGWATFTNGGPGINANGYLPGTTKFATPPGAYDRVSDASVAYDAKHNIWMISYLGVTGTKGKAILISTSSDGVNWDILPVTIATGLNLDKNWTVCDNTPSSKFYGHCYTEWDDVSKGNLIQMSTSTDGGMNWGAALSTAKKAHGLGGQPLVQPNGNVVIPYSGCLVVVGDVCPSTSLFHILAFTSLDGGNTWNAPDHIDGFVRFHKPAGGLRASALPSAVIDPSGKVYVVWSECNPEGFIICPANDFVISTLTNVDPNTGATTWSKPQPIPIDPTGSGVDHFIPGLAVSQTTTPGSPAHLGLVYYYYPKAKCTVNTCDLDVGFISSSDGGVTWGNKTQLAGPIKLAWLAKTTQSLMVGDYISTSDASGDAFPVIAAATAPGGGHFNEAMFTLVTGLR